MWNRPDDSKITYFIHVHKLLVTHDRFIYDNGTDYVIYGLFTSGQSYLSVYCYFVTRGTLPRIQVSTQVSRSRCTSVSCKLSLNPVWVLRRRGTGTTPLGNRGLPVCGTQFVREGIPCRKPDFGP